MADASSSRLLIVDDDPELLRFLIEELTQQGLDCEGASCGGDALLLLRQARFDLVVLDWTLPDFDGIEICRRLRSSGDTTPVLMLTAHDDLDDRVQALDLGIDDYLTKPFEVDELKARLRALLRRSQGHTNDVLRFRGISLDPQSLIVTYQHQTVPLSRRELALLQEFMSHPGRVFTRDTLTRLIYGWEEEVESNAIEVHIHHLRRKLFPDVVRTVRGIGYVMDKPEQVAP